jgi:hypothetical protein
LKETIRESKNLWFWLFQELKEYAVLNEPQKKVWMMVIYWFSWMVLSLIFCSLGENDSYMWVL